MTHFLLDTAEYYKYYYANALINIISFSNFKNASVNISLFSFPLLFFFLHFLTQQQSSRIYVYVERRIAKKISHSSFRYLSASDACLEIPETPSAG